MITAGPVGRGAGASVQRLACAHAALGVARAAGVAAEAAALQPLLASPGPVPMRPLRGPVPAAALEALAEAWVAADGARARIALPLSPGWPALAELSGLWDHAVPRGMVSFADPAPAQGRPWRWPLRIGVMPDAAGEALAAALGALVAVRMHLLRPVVLGFDADDCDLLLLPEDSAAALRREGLPAPPGPGGIGAVAILGGGPGWADQMALAALRRRLQADAVVQLDVAPAARVDWVGAFVSAMSEGLRFDLALAAAGQAEAAAAPGIGALGRDAARPLLVAAAGFVQAARPGPASAAITARTAHLNEPPTRWSLPPSPVPFPPSAPAPDPGPVPARPRPVPPTDVFAALEDTGGADPFAAPEATAPAAEPRFPDVLLHEDEHGRRGRAIDGQEALIPGQRYWLGFTIAPRDLLQGLAVAGGPVAIGALAEDDPRLLVTIAPRRAGDFAFPEPSRLLRLPQHGRATPVWFPFTVGEDARGLPELELRVHFRLNLVEFILVTLKVGVAEGQSRISQRVQHREPAHDIAALHRPRALAIHVRGTPEGYALTLTMAREDGGQVRAQAATRLIGTVELERRLQHVRDFWLRCGLDRLGGAVDAPAPLRAELTAELLEIGRSLWTLLLRGGERGGSLAALEAFLRENPLPEGALVQVTLDASAQDFVFPWALLCDVGVAEGDIGALWGFRQVIEQQVLRLAEDDGAVGGEGPLQLDFALYGRFRPYSKDQKAWMAALAEQAGARLRLRGPEERHGGLAAMIREGRSGLLYVFSHGYTPFLFPDWLEALKRNLGEAGARGDEGAADLLATLGRGDFRENQAWIELTTGKLTLESLYRADVEGEGRPIVVLNMCRSAQVMPGLSQSFIAFFLLRAGARAVLGTECPVPPAFADAFARLLVPRLLGGEPLGQALRAARQGMMARHGNPLGLAYTLWGGALARLDPPALEPPQQQQGASDG